MDEKTQTPRRSNVVYTAEPLYQDNPAVPSLSWEELIEGFLWSLSSSLQRRHNSHRNTQGIPPYLEIPQSKDRSISQILSSF